MDAIKSEIKAELHQTPHDPSKYPEPNCNNAAVGKNVILMIGDGFGWEPNRAGGIAVQVLKELEDLGVSSHGTTNQTLAAIAKAQFVGRTLDDYYMSGRGAGLNSQNQLDTFALMGTSTVLVDGASPQTITNRGNYSFYAKASSMRGPVNKVNGKSGSPKSGERNLLTDSDGLPIRFDPRDVLDGGMVVGWDLNKGCLPWQAADIVTGRKTKEEAGCPNFDPMYRHNYATDSANTATAMATGYKVANNMMSVDLYEDAVPTLLEEAMKCGKAGGVVSSVPVIHATPGAFITHSAYRKDNLMNVVTNEIDPTLIMGGCVSRYQPTQGHKDRLAANGGYFSQDVSIPGEQLLANMSSLNPNNGDKVIACTINDYNMPYRGIDSSYTGRHGDDDDETTTNVVDYYPADVVASVPKMKTQCEKAIEFRGKNDKGFSLMMEQGDIDWALHENHMDDMIGAILDYNDCMQVFIDYIEANGGYEKNALYVTADHDHFLHLESHFPETLAQKIIDGKSEEMIPPTHVQARGGGLHPDTDVDRFQWDEAVVQDVAHFHALRGHTNMPLPVYASGDEGCIPQQLGRSYNVLGKTVEMPPNLLDQVHLHECVRKQLLGV